MRRITVWAVIALFAGLIQAPALAGGEYDHFSVQHERELGKRLRVVVGDCEDGPGWDAKIEWRIKDADRKTVRRGSRWAEDDGETPVRISLSDTKFAPGKYRIIVKCIHVFDNGGTGLWWKERGHFHVQRPSGLGAIIVTP